MNYNIVIFINKIFDDLRIKIYNFPLKIFLFQYFLIHICFIYINEFSAPIYANKLINTSNLGTLNTYQTNSKLKNNSFVENIPIVKIFGPLTLDINNIRFKSGIIFIPSLNELNKPIFLAVNCKKSLINVKNPKGWKGWESPFYEYEIKIINQFCN